MKWKILIIIILIFLVLYWINNQILENMLQDDPKLIELRSILEPVLRKNNKYTGKLTVLNDRDLMNEVILYRGEKSYTINKHKIHICLFDENGEYYSNNTLIYVLAHELAHVINTKNVGHTQEFHDIFEELLDLLTEKGVYSPSIPVPLSYCTYND